MKNLNLLLFVLTVSVFTLNNTYGQSTQEALKYMNEIFMPVEETKNETWQYLKAVTKGKGARKVENKRQNLILEIKNAKSRVQRVGRFHDNDSLRMALVNYLALSYTVLKEDFDKILDMEDIAEQSYDLMEAYLLAKEMANNKLDSSYAIAVAAQESFALMYGITLNKADADKQSEKIKKASETLEYYNDVYLIFFKVYKQEFYVLDALQRDDIVAFEQNASTLAVYADEAINELKELSNYRGDGKLKVGAQKAMYFYKNEAEKDFPGMTDYFLKKDSFEKIQKAMESKSKRDITQEDVDQYNKAADEFNAAANRSNQISESTNKARSSMLNNWNKTVDQFFDTHAN